ncbi:GTP-binding protein [Filobacillus milosensis]|uniref:GTP-binding protein n=1 Tax=Filobacillus milosensis TaxID=94137 RepID=A0A4Y8IL30_9BACI|nr:putative glycoside hydrolase [Filobacillus milosensis]TFB22019.1 GTP-binding protein [Filobacillus milosensis]
MRKKNYIMFVVALLLCFWTTNLVFADEENTEEETIKTVSFLQGFETNIKERVLPDPLPRYVYDSGLNFEYPDAVRGIFLTGHSAGNSKFEGLIDYINNTALNAMVIDVKDDNGYITYKYAEDSPYFEASRNFISEPRAMLERLEEEQIYPIARVVVFKDTYLAHKKPEWSFKENGQIWENGNKDAFVNPFVKDVWKYNVEIAKEAAKLGFQEIQFDYVRFPEGFERRDEILEYSRGDYDDASLDNVKERVKAVSEFVAYAKKELEPYQVDVSVDIFGYSATIEEAPGIGQNFTKISENVDVISSMIYPSHWGPGYFDIPFPDKEPYRLVDEYAKKENEVLAKLENAPTSRPWIQDFTASWLYRGSPFVYGPKQVQAQIEALYANGIYEYLIWDPSNKYTRGVDYDPKN